MRTVEDFDAAHPPGRPIATPVSFAGTRMAHIIPCGGDWENADVYRALCDAVSADFWNPMRHDPLCVACVNLWETARAIDIAAGAVQSHATVAAWVFDPNGVHDRPCAAPGLLSYRYRGQFGWIMIGAHDFDDAMVQAARSTDEPIDRQRMQYWDGTRYV